MVRPVLKENVFNMLDHPDYFKAKSRVLSHLVLWVSGACRLTSPERCAYTDVLLMQNLRQEPLAFILEQFRDRLRTDGHRLSENSLFEQALLLAQEEYTEGDSILDLVDVAN